MSFAGSIQMILYSMLTCTIGSQGGPNKMAAANFLWLHFLNNRSSIQSFFFEIGEHFPWLSAPFFYHVMLHVTITVFSHIIRERAEG